MKRIVVSGFSIPMILMDEIEKKRGDISRSRFVTRLIEESLAKRQAIGKEVGKKLEA